MLTGSLNVLLWLSYVVMLSLYAFAFGSYGATFLPQPWQAMGAHVLISLAILVIAGLNLLSAEGSAWQRTDRRAEDYDPLLFVGAGAASISTARIDPASWSPPVQLAAGGMIIFLAYEGFELIANIAQDVKDAGEPCGGRTTRPSCS